jgi:hypothetical protein
VITSATVAGSVTTIGVQVTGPAATDVVVDVFSNAVCDWNGAGEGETYLAQRRVTTGANGVATFNVAVGVAIPVGHLITATATRAGLNTSQFSTCKAVQ